MRNLPDRWQAAVDVGCGAGVLAGKLASRFAHVTGIDGDEGMAAAVDRARRSWRPRRRPNIQRAADVMYQSGPLHSRFTITPMTGPPGAGCGARPGVVGPEVITARHRDIALLVAGYYFMEMLDGTKFIVP